MPYDNKEFYSTKYLWTIIAKMERTEFCFSKQELMVLGSLKLAKLK